MNSTSELQHRVLCETLRNLIAPGGRVRLSPYVEATQLKVLFGEVPDQQNRSQNVERILGGNQDKISNLAETFVSFSKRFDEEDYETDEFLDLYLAYYFTTNVCKVQLCLLELLEQRRIPKDINLVDFGVGTGTTAIAFLDFCLVWATVSSFRNEPWPIKTISIAGYDLKHGCLDKSREVLVAFSNILSDRIAGLGEGSQLYKSFQLITNAAESSSWSQLDLNLKTPDLPKEEILMVASTVINELKPEGKKNVANFLSGTKSGSIGVFVEPGDRNKTKNLNAYISDISVGNLEAFHPCSIRKENHGICSICWNARRESMHQTKLFKAIRSAIPDEQKKPVYDEVTNNLLSWSYSFVGNKQASSSVTSTHKLSNSDKEISTRFIGRFWYSNDREWRVGTNEPDIDIKDYNEKIKLCPLMGDLHANQLLLERPPGYQVPDMRHGDQVSVCRENKPLEFLEGKHRRRSVAVIRLSEDYELKPIVNRKEFKGSFINEYSLESRISIDEFAYRLFGFRSMYDFQHEILGRVLTGKSVLGIAATGGGKSECYILPSILMPGVTIVVSPLVSLMQDQYYNRICDRFGLGDLATYINGDVLFKERLARLKRMELGHYKLVFMTPEQLQRDHVLNAVKRADNAIGLTYLALDEAHCISQWGHDFRPSYLNLVSRLNKRDIRPYRIALTATASPQVREDLIQELKLSQEEDDVYIHSSNRPELNFIVKVLNSTADKIDYIKERLEQLALENDSSKTKEGAIVFMPWAGDANRKPTEGATPLTGKRSARATDFAGYLERNLTTQGQEGRRISLYHSKMDIDHSPDEDKIDEDQRYDDLSKIDFGDMTGRTRRRQQNAFIDGNVDIMVATKGFGMGIDKSNIRLIIHRTTPSNLEAYVQEAGRAGRDGSIADVVLCYSSDTPNDLETKQSSSDYDIQKFFLDQKYIRRQDLESICDFLKSCERKIAESIYFTNDELIDYFESRPSFNWPDFPPRLPYENESPQHGSILDRGHIYKQKTEYLFRVLSVLYKVRPDLQGHGRVALISSLEEPGARLVWDRSKEPKINIKAILASNAYFGEFFKEKGITSKDLQQCLGSESEESLIELARRLDLKLSQLNSMLLDINRADGRISEVKGKKKWSSDLLDFIFIASPHYGPAEGNISPSQWRGYAGAIKRAWGGIAYQRAGKAGRSKPNDDDWFWWEELPSSTGWEVVLGDAWTEKGPVKGYVEAFMDLHDRRKENDWGAYRLLLSDYIGANEKGMLQSSRSSADCLRAVMLGYLKTGEVVSGNCGSCSVCVPDGKFEQEMTKRSAVVSRLGTDFLELLTRFEGMQKYLPDTELMGVLWKFLKTEEKAGKLIEANILGWTGRLLNDTPGHKAALWIRQEGMVKGHFHSQERQEELLNNFETLLNECKGKELPRIRGLLISANEIVDTARYWKIKALVSSLLDNHIEEKECWNIVLKRKPELAKKHEAHIALSNLHQPHGYLPDKSACDLHRIGAARTAANYQDAYDFYMDFLPEWNWTKLEDELIKLNKNPASEGWVKQLVPDWFKAVTQKDSNTQEGVDDRSFAEEGCVESSVQLPKETEEKIEYILVRDLKQYFVAVEEDNRKSENLKYQCTVPDCDFILDCMSTRNPTDIMRKHSNEIHPEYGTRFRIDYGTKCVLCQTLLDENSIKKQEEHLRGHVKSVILKNEHE